MRKEGVYSFDTERSPMVGVCLHGSETSASIQDEEIFGQLRKYCLERCTHLRGINYAEY